MTLSSCVRWFTAVTREKSPAKSSTPPHADKLVHADLLHLRGEHPAGCSPHRSCNDHASSTATPSVERGAACCQHNAAIPWCSPRNPGPNEDITTHVIQLNVSHRFASSTQSAPLRGHLCAVASLHHDLLCGHAVLAVDGVSHMAGTHCFTRWLGRPAEVRRVVLEGATACPKLYSAAWLQPSSAASQLGCAKAAPQSACLFLTPTLLLLAV